MTPEIDHRGTEAQSLGKTPTAAPFSCSVPQCRCGENSGFSLSLARTLLDWSARAYTAPPDLHDPATDTSVLIRDTGPCIVVAFAGTKSLRNFLTDFDCRKIQTMIGKIHRGFYRALSGVESAVHRAIQDAAAKPLYFTGHSLGGALAMLLASRWPGFSFAALYTFGQPRVGDRAWSLHYSATPALQSRTFRLVNEEDIVPRVPGLLAGYRHAGQEIFFPLAAPQLSSVGGSLSSPSSFRSLRRSTPLTAPSPSRGYWENPLWYEKLASDLRESLRAWRARRYLALDQPLADHHISNYIARLNP